MLLERQEQGLIIMFDDDSEDALLVKTALARLHLPVGFYHAKSRDEFYDVLDRLMSHPGQIERSLLLLDLNMPGKNGVDWLQELRAQPLFDSLTIVVFSTTNMAEDRARSRKFGADDHVGKPDSVADLAKQLASLYERWLKPVS